MLTTVRRSRPKGPLRAVPGATNNRKIGGRLCYCNSYVLSVITDYQKATQCLTHAIERLHLISKSAYTYLYSLLHIASNNKYSSL